MNDRESRRTEMVIRSNDFFASRPDAFTKNSVATAKISALGEKITNIARHHEAQISGGGTAKQQTSLSDAHHDDLKDAMRDFVNFATSMAHDIDGLENKFRMPRSSGKRNLIAAARVFAADAEAFQSNFISYGMPANFIEDLSAKATNLEQTMSAASSAKETRVGATGGISAEVKEAVDLVRQLDPIVRMIYRHDATNLAAWTFASHIQRDDKPKPKPTTPKP